MILPSTPLGLSPRLERFQAHSKDPPRGACGNVRRGFPKSRPTAADDPEQRSGVAVFPQVLPYRLGENDLRDPCQLTVYLCPKAEDGNRRKSVLQRAR
jgi:hypothetical protein